MKTITTNINRFLPIGLSLIAISISVFTLIKSNKTENAEFSSKWTFGGGRDTNGYFSSTYYDGVHVELPKEKNKYTFKAPDVVNGKDYLWYYDGEALHLYRGFDKAVIGFHPDQIPCAIPVRIQCKIDKLKAQKAASA